MAKSSSLMTLRRVLRVGCLVGDRFLGFRLPSTIADDMCVAKPDSGAGTDFLGGFVIAADRFVAISDSGSGTGVLLGSGFRALERPGTGISHPGSGDWGRGVVPRSAGSRSVS